MEPATKVCDLDLDETRDLDRDETRDPSFSPRANALTSQGQSLSSVLPWSSVVLSIEWTWLPLLPLEQQENLPSSGPHLEEGDLHGQVWVLKSPAPEQALPWAPSAAGP